LPTYSWLKRFSRDFKQLSAEQQAIFLAAVTQLVADIELGQGFRKGLRIKGVQGTSGIFEMSWDNDGRATFSIGEEVVTGEMHIEWRRIGSHDIFREP
jgi:mRNA-degrading endonuclease YafQ of YafQ-DinJ toxin-antitoxin module